MRLQCFLKRTGSRQPYCYLKNKGDKNRKLRARMLMQSKVSMHVETVCLLSNRKADSHIKLSLDMDEYYDIIEKEQAEKK